jgi:4-hydroxybutyrate CoA-transferase
MRAIKADAHVVAAPYCATPTTLLGGLAQRVHAVSGVTLSAGLLFGDLPFVQETLNGQMRFRCWHLSADGRRMAKHGAVDYVPMRAREVATHLAAGIDVALVRVTPPDRCGQCSLGPSASYSRNLLDNARIRIAEVDPTYPRTRGADVSYPYDAFDFVVDADTPICSYEPAALEPQAEAVGAHVASIIPGGAHVQLGIGAVPDAVARALAAGGASQLKLTGMLSDAMLPLITSGRTASGIGSIKVAELLGTHALFDFAHENPVIEMKSSQSMHNPSWLARRGPMVSVCSALEVDLTGQAASESVGGHAIAGVGGSVDFFEGAGLSDGGIRVVALTSVAPNGTSRIRMTLPADTPVTLPRHSVDAVVTEHGVAWLRGLSVPERQAALAAVAHPAHRAELQAATAPARRSA